MRLSRRRLNRATLARQSLLRRASVGVVEAVERSGGLQAQEPASPYVALWTRLLDFDARALDLALHRRRVVKATLHRSTLHLVSADDYVAVLPALTSVTRTRWMHEVRGRPVERDLAELTEAMLDYAAQPRTNVELRDHAATLGEPVPADELWRRIRRYGAFLHVPGDAPWLFARRPVQIAARSWLPEATVDEDASLASVVRAHLRAFGPSRMADIAQWSGLSVTALRRGLVHLEDGELTVRHEDSDGRELIDLDGAPLPDEDEPAPPRLLPMWDETLLAYADRSRVVPERCRKRVIVTGGDVLPTFLMDGHVAGLWWAERDGEAAPRIVLEPFEPMAGSERDALEHEASRLATFLAEREPAVYARYRYSRRRA